MRYSAFAVAAISLCLAGCVAMQQQQMVNNAKACFAAVYASPQAAPLRVKQPLIVTDATLAQLSDPTFVTPAEAGAISNTQPQLKACQKELLAQMQSMALTAVLIFAEAYRDADDDLLLLLERKLNWGQFTKHRRDQTLLHQQQLVAEGNRLDAEQQARNATLIQNLSTAYALTQAAQPAQPPLATFTSCTQQGAFTNCWQR